MYYTGRARSVASSPPHKLVGGVLQGSCHCSVAVVLQARGSFATRLRTPKIRFWGTRQPDAVPTPSDITALPSCAGRLAFRRRRRRPNQRST